MNYVVNIIFGIFSCLVIIKVYKVFLLNTNRNGISRGSKGQACDYKRDRLWARFLIGNNAIFFSFLRSSSSVPSEFSGKWGAEPTLVHTAWSWNNNNPNMKIKSLWCSGIASDYKGIAYVFDTCSEKLLFSFSRFSKSNCFIEFKSGKRWRKNDLILYSVCLSLLFTNILVITILLS